MALPRNGPPRGRAALIIIAVCVKAAAHPPPPPPATFELYAPPHDPQSQPSWLRNLARKREAIVKSINYTGAIYEDPAVNWTRQSYVQPQALLFDRYLYDPDTHSYTVDRYLADVTKRYGGIDSVLVWPTYTNIGVDARNQFDYFRALPGGLAGLSNLTAQFKARGVRVLWAYNPWDQSTRLEGEPHWATLARLLKQTGGDGFNGDTMPTMFRQFWTAGVEVGHKIVGEMEGGGYPVADGHPQDDSWESNNWDPMGWGYFESGKPDGITYAYDVAPGVDRLKWLDGRRMTHVCDRWAKNRTDPLQYAFLNGDGFESWENVWGIFMKITPRDGEALRRMATLFRWLGSQAFIQDFASWEPYTPDLERDRSLPFTLGGPIASKFQHHSGDCLWLIVNRASSPATAVLNVSGCKAGRQLYDLYHGVQLDKRSRVQVRLEANGYGAVLATSRSASLPLRELLATMSRLTTKPLGEFSAEWAPLPQEMFNIPQRAARTDVAPPGMVMVPRTLYRFRTAGVEIEGGCEVSKDTWGVCCNSTRLCPGDKECSTPCALAGDDSRGVDVQFPWERKPARFHDHTLRLGPFFMDVNLVSKEEYSKYLVSTGYVPRDHHNFLVGWTKGYDGALRPQPGTERQPVVWVSLREARLYCEWAGKRLPHSYEWQLAGQGTDGRLYPWGNTRYDGKTRHFPKPVAGHVDPELPDVGTFSPGGDSVFGVADLVGVVWQYTDEFRDEHTRRVVLKGSSPYVPMVSDAVPSRPQAANWYFSQALELDRHNTLMLMDDSYERAATIGFRCAADHKDGPSGPVHAEEGEFTLVV